MKKRVRFALLLSALISLLNSSCTCYEQMKVYHNYDSEKKLYFHFKEDVLIWKLNLHVYDEESREIWQIYSKIEPQINAKDAKIYYGVMPGRHINPKMFIGQEKAKPMVKGRKYSVSVLIDGHMSGYLDFIYEPPD